MHPLDLNLVARRRRVSPLGLVLLAAGLAATAAVALDLVDARDELERVQAHQARSLRPAAPPRARADAKLAARDDVKTAQGVSLQLRQPWNALFNDIDAVLAPGVAVLGVEAQGQAHTLRITGEAKEMADVVAYVEQLRSSPSIGSAYLSHHEERQAGAVTVLRFSLDAGWRQAL